MESKRVGSAQEAKLESASSKITVISQGKIYQKLFIVDLYNIFLRFFQTAIPILFTDPVDCTYNYVTVKIHAVSVYKNHSYKNQR